VACELSAVNVAGTSVGFTNMCSIIVGGAIMQPLIGWLLDLGWNGEYANNIRMYTAENFQTVMLILPAGLMICLVLCMFLKESYGGRKDEKDEEASLQNILEQPA